MPNRHGATPQLIQLVRVVPVVQAYDLVGGSLTLVSLEIYAEGFLVHTQLKYVTESRTIRMRDAGEAVPGRWSRATLATPEVIFEATDEGGENHACWSSGGYGGGQRPGEMLWRRDYVFAPTVGPKARTLQLRVAAVEWVTNDPTQPSPMVEANQLIDWTLIVPLSSA